MTLQWPPRRPSSSATARALLRIPAPIGSVGRLFSWAGPATIDSAGIPQAISCTSSHFCLMADLSGNVATFNGATWSATSDVDPGATAGTVTGTG